MEAKYWASPQARDFRSGETIENYGNPRPLNEQVVNWATPTAGEAKGRAYQNDNHDQEKPRFSLTGEAQNWNTPRAEDSESPELALSP